MVDKIVDAINEILGGGDGTTQDNPPQGNPPQDQPSTGFVPADGSSSQDQHAGDKGRNLDQLVADAKKQIGENP